MDEIVHHHSSDPGEHLAEVCQHQHEFEARVMERLDRIEATTTVAAIVDEIVAEEVADLTEEVEELTEEVEELTDEVEETVDEEVSEETEDKSSEEDDTEVVDMEDKPEKEHHEEERHDAPEPAESHKPNPFRR